MSYVTERTDKNPCPPGGLPSTARAVRAGEKTSQNVTCEQTIGAPEKRKDTREQNRRQRSAGGAPGGAGLTAKVRIE